MSRKEVLREIMCPPGDKHEDDTERGKTFLRVRVILLFFLITKTNIMMSDS